MKPIKSEELLDNLKLMSSKDSEIQSKAKCELNEMVSQIEEALKEDGQVELITPMGKVLMNRDELIKWLKSLPDSEPISIKENAKKAFKFLNGLNDKT